MSLLLNMDSKNLKMNEHFSFWQKPMAIFFLVPPALAGGNS